MKNIPVAGKEAYLKTMLLQAEKLNRRMRWKATHHDNSENDVVAKETFGFKSARVPRPLEPLKAFEEDLYNMICNIEFKNRHNTFQQQLNRDVREIKNSKEVYIKADKTNNYYRMTSDRYVQLLHDNVTKEYQHSSEGTKRAIDAEASTIASKLGIADRVEICAERPAYLTMKDHKDDFWRKPSCRLINPAKSEIGMISKRILEDLCHQI